VSPDVTACCAETLGVAPCRSEYDARLGNPLVEGSIPGRGIQPQTELFPRFISLRSDCRDLTARLPAAEYPLKHRFFCRKRSG
jgi:hypothetical protein